MKEKEHLNKMQYRFGIQGEDKLSENGGGWLKFMWPSPLNIDTRARS